MWTRCGLDKNAHLVQAKLAEIKTFLFSGLDGLDKMKLLHGENQKRVIDEAFYKVHI